MKKRIVNATSLDDIRIELVGQSRAITTSATNVIDALSLFNLCVELDSELDGVSVPASAAAILNAIHELCSP